MTDRVGQQLGNYRLVRLLGQGGFAEVYLAEHVYLETQAAIKVLQTQLAQQDIEQFRIEARTIARLEHPHIVRVLEFGVEGTIPFLVMSYAVGGTLRQHHPKGTRLELPIVVSYVRQVASALQYAHDQKIIHRDVKPENMLLGRHDEVLLSDFGIALVAQTSRHQLTQAPTGTVAYMAPEQILGKPSRASDQYSLGIVVYEWLSGTLPFQGSAFELYGQHLHVPPTPLRERVPALSPMVEQVVMLALAKDPKQRWASVQAFATALEQAGQVEASETLPMIQSAQQASEITILSQSRHPSELGTRLGESQQPTERVSAPNQGAIPIGLSPSASSTVLPADARTVPSESPQATELVAPAGQASEPKDVISQAAPTEAVTPSPGRSRGGEHVPEVVKERSPEEERLREAREEQARRTKEERAQKAREKRLRKAEEEKAQNAGEEQARKDEEQAQKAREERLRKAQEEQAQKVREEQARKAQEERLRDISTYPPGKQAIAPVAQSGPEPTRKISRRTVIIGLVGAGVTAVVAGGTWWILTPHTLYTYTRHSTNVLGIAWSPDGTRIASANGNVQVWDAADGGHVYTYRGHSSYVYTVAWSPDGKHIASGSNDYTVQVWDAADGGHVFTYSGHSGVATAVAWSPDGKRIVSAGYPVQVWDAADGGHVYSYRGHSSGVNAVAWSPDGRRIASGGNDYTVQVWDAVNGSHVYSYRGHSSGVNAVAWSPDGTRIASGSSDKTVQVWDAADGGNVYSYRGHADSYFGVLAVAWSPNGKRIASGSAGVQVWDAADGSHVYSYRGHPYFVYAVAWSPDGKRIASGGDDKTVQVWQAP